MERTDKKKRRRVGAELVLGPAAANAWRKKEFPSDQKELELEIARAFCGALGDDFAAEKSGNEPFDVEVFSSARNQLVAGVQLVDAYDDAERRRDSDRRRAMEGLRRDAQLATSLDGWDIRIRTAFALAPGAESNKVSFQLPIIRDILARVDWKQTEFSITNSIVTVAGNRRADAPTGAFRYLWHGGLLPLPRESLFLEAVESKLSKRYSRADEKVPFWLLVYSLRATPDARDYRTCRELVGKNKTPFDEIFLFSVMGGDVYQLSVEYELDDLVPETDGGFQIDPSSFLDSGAFDDDNYVEVKL